MDINLEVIDHLSPHELANTLPTAIATQIRAIPDQVLSLGLDALEAKIPDNLKIDASRARIAFWLEFERHHRTGIAFSLASVYSGLMPYRRFQRDIVSNSYVLAYLITPPPAYHVVMDEMLHYGLALQREILQLSHFQKDKDGDYVLDHALLKIKNTIIDGVHDRLKGLPVAKSLNLSKTIVDSSEEEKVASKRSLAELDQRIKELESGEGKA